LHYLNQHIFRIDGVECDKKWFYWVLKAVTHYVETEAHGIIGMVHITQSKLGRILVPWAPEPEQKAIAAFLDQAAQHFDQLITKVNAVIERLADYRQALISATVTGKIDVREA